MNPTGMIWLPLWFRDKIKARNLEIDFLVVDAPTACNIILGRPTLYKVKAVIASYLLQLQYKGDDGRVRKLQGDECIAQECYPVGIRPLVELLFRDRPAKVSPSDKRSRVTHPPPTETLAICTLSSTGPWMTQPETHRRLRRDPAGPRDGD